MPPESRGSATAVAASGDGAFWADPDARRVAGLTARSAMLGWRAALMELADSAPTFVRRMQNLALGNWHLLLTHDRAGTSLDVGTGFGSLPLGLAGYYRQALGAEMLPDRVRYAALRGREEGAGCRFVQGSGFALPVRDGAVSLVTLNGVLEWAGLYQGGNPRARQLDMLREARRVLAPAGHLAVAIENRFALESWLGLRDTHTGIAGPTLLPRWVAGALTRVRTGAPYRTYLYHRAGYRRLLGAAGFERVRVLDLVSSYNDYDFILDTGDSASYQLLARAGAIRAFYAPAGKLRQLLADRAPSVLAGLAYAYLVVGGASAITLLDAEHPLWARAGQAGLGPGRFRLACQGTAPGQLGLLTHDGREVTGLLELGTTLPGEPDGSTLRTPARARLTAPLIPTARFRWRGLHVRLWQPGA